MPDTDGGFRPGERRLASEYDQAIQDYDLALRLTPAYAVAFDNSGFGYPMAWRTNSAIEGM